jgi:hypothetical protein
MAPNDNWLTRTMNAATAGVGNFVGGVVNAVGNGVAGAGRGAGTRYEDLSISCSSCRRVTDWYVA